MLRRVSFEIVRAKGGVLAVTPCVDGVPLAYERAKGYHLAGGYGGLIPENFNCGPLDEYLTGTNKSDYWMKLTGIYLLVCTCGEAGCWPLIASVCQKDDTIRWGGFVQPHRRERNHSEFGPFTFSRAQYEEGVKGLLIRLNSAGANSAM